MDNMNLEAFLTVAQQGSASLAAKQLHLTQSAISKRIAMLETQVGVKLFHRRKNRLVLSEAGKILLPFAEEIFNTIHESKRALFSHKDSKLNQLKIAVGHFAGIQEFPMLLKKFIALFTQLRLKMIFQLPLSVKETFEQASAEFCVNEITTDIDKSFTAIPLWQYPMKFVVHKEHPLASIKKLTLKDLQAYPAILPSAQMPARAFINQLFAAAHLDFDADYEVNIMLVIHRLIMAKIGWGILPEPLVTQQMHVLTPTKDPFFYTFYVIYKNEKSLSTVAKKFIDMLLESRHPIKKT